MNFHSSTTGTIEIYKETTKVTITKIIIAIRTIETTKQYVTAIFVLFSSSEAVVILK